MAPRAPIRAPAQARVTTRRRLPGHERRVLILEAALRTFAANGYDGAAMDEIASAAGISKAVVYDHVASKRDLYTQLLHAIRDEIERTVEEALRAPGVNGEERVAVAVDSIYRYVEEHPQASRLLVLELQGASVSAIGLELEDRLTDHLARTLGSDPTLFERRPDRERQLVILAELFKSAVLGLTNWWYRTPDAARADLVERTVEVVWSAIERARTDVAV
jgi:AcrR family transcriptional regulator